LQKLAHIAWIININKLTPHAADQSNSKVNQTQRPHLDKHVPYIFDDWNGKTIEIAGDEPLENPHRIVQHQIRVNVIAQLWIDSLEHVFEYHRVNVGKWEPVFI